MTSLRGPTAAVTRPSHFQVHEERLASNLRRIRGSSRVIFSPICSGPGRSFATAAQQPLLVGGGVVQGRLRQNEVELLNQGGEPAGCPLRPAVREVAKPLAVLVDARVSRQSRLGRHLDHQVAPRHHLARQDVSAADLVAGEELGGLPLDLALADDHAALAADPLAAADGPHVDPRLASGFQKGLAFFRRGLALVGKETDAKAVTEGSGFGFRDRGYRSAAYPFGTLARMEHEKHGPRRRQPSVGAAPSRPLRLCSVFYPWRHSHAFHCLLR